MGHPHSSNPFLGLPKSDLKGALLNRLSLLANLRTESKRCRQRLASARSEMHQIQYELAQIQYSLDTDKIAQFPKPKPVEEPETERTFGRWGKVTFEPTVPKENPRKRTASGD